MKVFIAVFALIAAAQAGIVPALSPQVIPATTLVRTPQHDSAIIKSDRLGGNFAYSTVEGHAYAAVSPVVQNVVSPVGVTYSSTPIATPVNLIHQQYAIPQVIGAPQYIGAPQWVPQAVIPQTVVPQIYPDVSSFAPGIIPPAFSINPIDNLVPSSPAEEKPTEEATAEAPASVEAPSEPAPEAPQADVVSVESA